MIGRIRNSIFTKILWGLIGLYLLNISVDPADPYPKHTPEDLSFNDQESIIEIILEKVLGYEDAVKEYDDKDTEDHKEKSNTKTHLVANNTTTQSNSHRQAIEGKKRYPDHNSLLADGFAKIDSPPPKP
jgi:hypothetical protein